jgi:hypothetical protein
VLGLVLSLRQVLLLLPQMLRELLPPTIMNLLLLPPIFIAFGRGAFDGYHLCSVWLSPFATLLYLPLPFLFVNPACFYLSLGFACPFAWLICLLLLFLCFSKRLSLGLLSFVLLLKFLQPVCIWLNWTALIITQLLQWVLFLLHLRLELLCLFYSLLASFFIDERGVLGLHQKRLFLLLRALLDLPPSKFIFQPRSTDSSPFLIPSHLTFRIVVIVVLEIPLNRKTQSLSKLPCCLHYLFTAPSQWVNRQVGFPTPDHVSVLLDEAGAALHIRSRS